MENDNYYWDITAKYLQGKANLLEQEELQAWRKSDIEHEAQFKAQEKLWKLTEFTPEHEVNTEKAWNQTRLKIEAKSKEQRPIRSLFYLSLKIAASIAIVFSGIWFYKNNGAANEMLVVKSGNKRIEVVLPDSSRVWLNKESELAYEKAFSSTERNVKLEGEGFFEVQKNPKRPFIIQTGNVQTKVLGTSFNLRNYPAEPNIDLVVATGRVSFKAKTSEDEAIVTPGNGASISKTNNQLSKYRIANNNAWSWKSGRLRFDNKPLKEVLRDLERGYGIDLNLQNDNLGTCRFSGNFENAKMEEVLKVLRITLDLNYEKVAKHTIIITGSGCNN
jgi:ferric-dicitrate binding protein FerR (iron transport regulator)